VWDSLNPRSVIRVISIPSLLSLKERKNSPQSGVGLNDDHIEHSFDEPMYHKNLGF